MNRHYAPKCGAHSAIVSSDPNTCSVVKMNFRRRTLVFLAIFAVLWFSFLTIYQNDRHKFYIELGGAIAGIRQMYAVDNAVKPITGHKKILIWNSANRIETASFGFDREAFVRNQCPVHDCSIHLAANSTLPLESYDAIIVHVHELWMTTLPKMARQPGQRLIFLTQESPSVMNLRNTLKTDPALYINYFNWTMTYRSDADIGLRYGRIHPRSGSPLHQQAIEAKIVETHTSGVNYAHNKNKSIAWMVSHCMTHSRREVYVNELRKYVDVDVYGACGQLNCSRISEHWLSEASCYDMLEANYKFYLSFENSICDDYVTEKFFNILQHNIVPIVYGGADYKRIAPHHSYIDASQYSAKDLANYIRRLNNNDTLYNEFFWWKNHYDVEAGVEQMSRHAFCDLCAKLHQSTEVKSYSSNLIGEWWNGTTCRPANASLFASH